ncbi:glucose-1-phosphate thymidylyltransferase [Planctomycetales bacterium]|nr:glucose-1-phosphate thymidylyltransferase [Planctomycetales bacterium]
MHIILFEDSLSSQLFPATIARAAFALNIGTYRLIDFAYTLSDNIEVIVRPYLKDLVSKDFTNLWTPDKGSRSEPVLVLNARVVPHISVFEQLKQFIQEGHSGIISSPNGVVCALFAQQNPFPHDLIGASQLLGIIDDMHLPPLNAQIPLLEYVHDIVRYQLRTMNDNLNYRLKNGEYKEIADGVFSADGKPLGQFCVTDSSKGPIVLESGVDIGPYTFFRGPVYVGSKSKIIEHSALKDAVTLGSTTKAGGEIEATVIESFSNKQHHGFLGHSYLGSWVNLGAGTSNSDLKNTYGEVTMEYSNKKVKTGMQFVGSFIGDYAKSAINTSVFTGKTIGACSMVYGFVTTNVPSFVNYARSFGQVTETAVETLVQTQARMFSRRNVEQRPCDVQLLRDIYEMTKHERQLASEPLSL